MLQLLGTSVRFFSYKRSTYDEVTENKTDTEEKTWAKPHNGTYHLPCAKDIESESTRASQEGRPREPFLNPENIPQDLYKGDLMFTTSETTKELDAAIVKAQAEIQVAIKDKQNPHFRSTYADFDSLITASRPSLLKHGIAFTQWPVATSDGRLHLVTRMSHSGQFIQATCSFPVDKPSAQGFGSAITYAKRYALAAALGIQTGVDDDGNAASPERSNGHPASYPSSGKAQIPATIPRMDPFMGADPQTYVIPFGKYKGKKFKELKNTDVEGWLMYLKDKAEQENDPLSENLLQAMAMFKAYMRLTDVEIPF